MRLFLYLIRWQLSTPILAICVAYLANFSVLFSTIVANLVGGLLFYNIDKIIFQKGDKIKNVKKHI